MIDLAAVGQLIRQDDERLRQTCLKGQAKMTEGEACIADVLLAIHYRLGSLIELTSIKP